MTNNLLRGHVAARKGHDLAAAGRGIKRCKRCDAVRRELDDGAVRWRMADGRESTDPPRCIPKSGETRSQNAETCHV